MLVCKRRPVNVLAFPYHRQVVDRESRRHPHPSGAPMEATDWCVRDLSHTLLPLHTQLSMPLKFC